MSGNSRAIFSNQDGIHDNLELIVRKHFTTVFKKPLAAHTVAAFEAIKPIVDDALSSGVTLIFDSGCGTALSTKIIAQQNPDALVIGIDRSFQRLNKEYNQSLPNNALLVQADCVDFWLLANKAGWKLKQHFLLYPNPYPKAKHLKRRWHAHPIFPTLLALGGEIVFRTNWKIYADEFCATLNFLDHKNSGVVVLSSKKPMTLFEKKYHESGQSLYQCNSFVE